LPRQCPPESQAASCSAMDEARAAVEGVARCAASLRLINSVGSARAESLSNKAAEVLQCLDPSARTWQCARMGGAEVLMPGSYAAVCELASSCLYLHDDVDLELIASMSDCFGDGGMIIWGFSVDVAETVVLSLAAVASVLTRGISDHTKVAPHVEKLFADMDHISVHIFAGLCRVAFEQDGTGDNNNLSAEEQRLAHAFQAICIWSVAILCNLMQGQLTAQTLWEMAGGDSLWSLVLIKGMLAYSPAGSGVTLDGVPLPVPPQLAELKEVVVLATAHLGSPSLAFYDEVDANLIADDIDGGFTMSERMVGLSMHRAKLATAAADCKFLETLLMELTSASPSWLPPTVALLAALLTPPHVDLAVWTKCVAEEEEAGALEALTLQEAREAREALAWQLTVHSNSLWLLLSGAVPFCMVNSSRLSFLLDCATLAHSVPMNPGTCRYFLDCCFRGECPSWDGASLASVLALSINCDMVPQEDPLCAMLFLADAATKALASERLARSRAPLRQNEALQRWAEVLGAALDACGRLLPSLPAPLPAFPAEALPPLPSGPTPPPPLPQPQQPPAKPSLRETLRGAPEELCCALDGRLLMDPVRTPQGYVFERASLVQALASTPGTCPLSGLPLSLEACQRDGEIRAQATRWVRQATQRQRG